MKRIYCFYPLKKTEGFVKQQLFLGLPIMLKHTYTLTYPQNYSSTFDMKLKISFQIISYEVYAISRKIRSRFTHKFENRGTACFALI